MKLFRSFNDTYKGLLLVGGAGGLILTSLAAIMFTFRAQCEPFLRLILTLFVPKRAVYHYNPDSYYFWVGCVAGISLIWVVICVVAIFNKPQTDRRIDRNLKRRITQSARGAPLEPD